MINPEPSGPTGVAIVCVNQRIEFYLGVGSVRSLDLLPQLRKKSCSTQSLQVKLEFVGMLVSDGQLIFVLIANWEATAEIGNLFWVLLLGSEEPLAR